MFHSITFTKKTGEVEFWGTFETLKAAKKDAKFLATRAFIKEISIYCGRAGEELIERVGA